MNQEKLENIAKNLQKRILESRDKNNCSDEPSQHSFLD